MSIDEQENEYEFDDSNVLDDEELRSVDPFSSDSENDADEVYMSTSPPVIVSQDLDTEPERYTLKESMMSFQH